MTANILLTHTAVNGGTPATIICDKVTVSGKKNIIQKPYANGLSLSEVQTKSFENLKYVISGVHLTDGTNILDWDDVLALYKASYDGTDAATLNITYGKTGAEKVLNGLSASTDIKVILETPSLPIDARDSKGGYLPVATLTFIETA